MLDDPGLVLRGPVAHPDPPEVLGSLRVPGNATSRIQTRWSETNKTQRLAILGEHVGKDVSLTPRDGERSQSTTRMSFVYPNTEMRGKLNG